MRYKRITAEIAIVLVAVTLVAVPGTAAPVNINYWPPSPGGFIAKYGANQGSLASYYVSPSSGSVFAKASVVSSTGLSYAVCALEYRFTADRREALKVDYILDLDYWLCAGPVAFGQPTDAWIRVYFEFVDLDYSPYTDIDIIHHVGVANSWSPFWWTIPKQVTHNGDRVISGTTESDFSTISGHDYAFRLYISVHASSLKPRSYAHVWRSPTNSDRARVKINSLYLYYW